MGAGGVLLSARARLARRAGVRRARKSVVYRVRAFGCQWARGQCGLPPGRPSSRSRWGRLGPFRRTGRRRARRCRRARSVWRSRNQGRDDVEMSTVKSIDRDRRRRLRQESLNGGMFGRGVRAVLQHAWGTPPSHEPRAQHDGALKLFRAPGGSGALRGRVRSMRRASSEYEGASKLERPKGSGTRQYRV